MPAQVTGMALNKIKAPVNIKYECYVILIET